MVVLGLGLGGLMQVLVLVAQNSVSQRDLGTATSTATFFRSTGGSIGLPIFGAIYTNTLNRNLVKDLPPAIHGGVVETFDQSLRVVFLAGVPFAVVAFVRVWLLKELPLRTRPAPMLEGIDERFGETQMSNLA